MRILRVVGLFAAAVVVTLVSARPVQATDFTTYGFDSGRDGWNSNETILNPSNVPGIQRIVNVPLGSGTVVSDATPLYLSNENTPYGATNVVYVATEDNTIFAYSPRLQRQVWSHAAYSPGPPVDKNNTACPDVTSPHLGITSTPVIDTSTDTMYFVTDDWEGSNAAFRLHAISPGDGSEKIVAGGVVIPIGYNANLEKQRPALTLANGMIYIAFGGAGCDFNKNQAYGQIFAYSASTLQKTYGPYVPANLSNGNCGQGTSAVYLDSIWMSGSGPAVDPNGNIMFATGNGCLNYPYSLGQTLIRLSPQLTYPTSQYYDTFEPNNVAALNNADLDYGSGGVSIGTTGLMVSGGKDGMTWIHTGQILGGYCYNPCLHYQACSHQQTNGGLWGSNAVFTGSDGYWWIATGGNMYGSSPATTGMTIWELVGCNNHGGTEQLRQSTGDPLPSGGTIPLVTSNGTTSGTYVVWFVHRPTGAGPVGLYAYNAETMAVLTTQPAGNWTESKRYATLAPAVADGYVMLATGGYLEVWTVPGNYSGVRPSSRHRNS